MPKAKSIYVYDPYDAHSCACVCQRQKAHFVIHSYACVCQRQKAYFVWQTFALAQHNLRVWRRDRAGLSARRLHILARKHGHVLIGPFIVGGWGGMTVEGRSLSGVCRARVRVRAGVSQARACVRVRGPVPCICVEATPTAFLEKHVPPVPRDGIIACTFPRPFRVSRDTRTRGPGRAHVCRS